MATLLVITVAGATSAGLVGGVFFAFSTFVMRALAQLPASQGMAAMQRINVVVIHPMFLGLFLGTAPMFALAVLAAWMTSNLVCVAWLTGALALYLVGAVGVTLACNVPRNNHLAALTPESAEA